MYHQGAVPRCDGGGPLDRGSQGCGICILQAGVSIIFRVGGNRQRAGAVPIYRGHGKPGCVLCRPIQSVLSIQCGYFDRDGLTVPI